MYSIDTGIWPTYTAWPHTAPVPLAEISVHFKIHIVSMFHPVTFIVAVKMCGNQIATVL